MAYDISNCESSYIPRFVIITSIRGRNPCSVYVSNVYVFLFSWVWRVIERAIMIEQVLLFHLLGGGPFLLSLSVGNMGETHVPLTAHRSRSHRSRSHHSKQKAVHMEKVNISCSFTAHRKIHSKERNQPFIRCTKPFRESVHRSPSEKPLTDCTKPAIHRT